MNIDGKLNFNFKKFIFWLKFLTKFSYIHLKYIKKNLLIISKNLSLIVLLCMIGLFQIFQIWNPKLYLKRNNKKL
jgi:hypothetical protein